MSVDFECGLLRNTAVSGELTDEQCELLAAIADLRELESGEILFSEGETDHRLYVIVEGRLAVTRANTRGSWDTLHILNTGDLAGESGFLDSNVHSATLRAVGQTRVVSFGRDEFEKLLDRDPHLVYNVMRSIIKSMRSTQRRMNQQYQQLTHYISQTGKSF